MKLGDFIDFCNGRTSPERLAGASVPVMGSNGCIGFAEDSNVEQPCTVIGRVGSYCGSTHFVEQPCWVTDNAISAVSKDPRAARFWHGFLANFGLNMLAHGSGQPLLTQSVLKNIDVPNFTNEERYAIADVLGALDDKIAANQRVVSAQGVLVQTLVRRANQAGVCSRLDDVTRSVTRGVAPKYTDEGSWVVNQRCIRNQTVDLTAARTLSNLPENKAKRLELSDVLINSTGVGTLGRTARWIERIPDATADSHVSIVKFDERKVDPDFAGVVLTSMEKQIEDLAEGTTGQTELRRDLLSGVLLRLPRIEVQRQVGAQIRQFDASKRALEKENQVLAATRDELLPLLMNRKITVVEAEEAVGDVGVVKQKQQEEGDSDV